MVADLVAIPTENPPGKNYGACADFLEKTLRRAGLDCERFATSSSSDNRDDAPECLLATYGSGEQAFYFHGHFDVVPAQSPEQFQPTQKGHFVFGRGSCDMKGGIVAMLYAIQAVKELGAKLKHKIGLTLVPDEETGGKGGTAWLARQGLLGRGGVGMLTAEPTSGVAWNANRGAISLCVRVLGKAAHVGLQHQGANAFERMHEVVAQTAPTEARSGSSHYRTQYWLARITQLHFDARRTERRRDKLQCRTGRVLVHNRPADKSRRRSCNGESESSRTF